MRKHCNDNMDSVKSVSQDRKNYGKDENVAFVHEQRNHRTADYCSERSPICSSTFIRLSCFHV